jgi:hypothetical protein
LTTPRMQCTGEGLSTVHDAALDRRPLWTVQGAAARDALLAQTGAWDVTSQFVPNSTLSTGPHEQPTTSITKSSSWLVLGAVEDGTGTGTDSGANCTVALQGSTRSPTTIQATASLLTRVAIGQAVPCIATYVGHWHYTTTVLGAGRQAEREREGRGADRTG